MKEKEKEDRKQKKREGKKTEEEGNPKDGALRVGQVWSIHCLVSQDEQRREHWVLSIHEAIDLTGKKKEERS